MLLPFSQVTGETVGEVKVVDGMHQRKAEMSRHSDAFIALPGLSLTLSLSSPFILRICAMGTSVSFVTERQVAMGH